MTLLALLASLSSVVADHAALLRFIADRGGGASVRVGADSNGVRGLVTERACATGDVLLEVPLSLCISDGAGDDGSEPLAGCAPRWMWSLPWNVQLALTAHGRKRDASDVFLASWPAKPPPLPIACGPEELALSSDPSLPTKADEAFFWLDEQYWIAREAAEAAGVFKMAAEQGEEEEEDGDGIGTSAFPSAAAFRKYMYFVWSRCLRLSTGPHGVRRLLVPYLDLANHDAVPSAMYAASTRAHTYTAPAPPSSIVHSTALNNATL